MIVSFYRTFLPFFRYTARTLLISRISPGYQLPFANHFFFFQQNHVISCIMTTSFIFDAFSKFHSIVSLTQYIFNIIISSINTVPTIFIFLTLTHFLFLTQPSMLSTLHLFRISYWNFLECLSFDIQVEASKKRFLREFQSSQTLFI